jgi:hypothetical protein
VARPHPREEHHARLNIAYTPRKVIISSAITGAIHVAAPAARAAVDRGRGGRGRNTVGQIKCFFPGPQKGDLPDGERWAVEFVQLSTHNGTHLTSTARMNKGAGRVGALGAHRRICSRARLDAWPMQAEISKLDLNCLCSQAHAEVETPLAEETACRHELSVMRNTQHPLRFAERFVLRPIRAMRASWRP